MAVAVGGVMDGGEVRARMTLDLKDYANKIKRVQKEMEDTKKKSKKTKESIEKMGKGAAVAGAAMVGGFAAVVKQAADFEQQMSKVKAISGATGEDFQRLNETARHLGATTKFTATQAGEGMEYLALAGWKTNDIISAMPGMLDLAAAGALDLGRAADIVSDTMQAFGLDASTATHAADVFAYAQANANTNVEQMGEAMKYLSPIAHALGWSLEESSAATMSLANSGLKGSIAGQAFASSLARLAKPTKRMAGLMKKTGMEFFDAEGKMKSMPELVAEIEKGTKGMTEQQRSAALSVLFGAEAYKHWAILLDTGSGKLKDMTKNLQNCDGTAEQMSKTMIDNLYGSIEIFKSGVSEVAIKLGNHFIPSIRKGVDALTKFVEGLGKIDPNKVEIFVKVAGTAVGIIATAGAISKLAGALRTLVLGMGPIGWVITGLSVLGAAYVGYKTSTEQATRVNLDNVKAMQASADEFEKQTNRFKELREKNKLSNDEMLRLLDLQEKIKRNTDPEILKYLEDEFAELLKKSGLTNDEMKEYLGLNDKIIDQVPEVEQKISSQGKAYVTATDGIDKWNDAQREKIRLDLEAQRTNIENNHAQAIKDLKEAVRKQKEAKKEIEERVKIRDELEAKIKKKKEEYESSSTWVEKQLRGMELKALEDKLKTHKDIINARNDEVKEQNEVISGINEEIKKYGDVYSGLQEIYLKNVGITAEKGKEVEAVQKAIDETNTLIDKKKEEFGADGKITKEEQDQIDKLIEKRTKLEDTKKAIEDNKTAQEKVTTEVNRGVTEVKKFNDAAKDLNKELREKITKEVTVQYNRVLGATMSADTLKIGDKEYPFPDYLKNRYDPTPAKKFPESFGLYKRHEGGTLPKLHAGGSPMFSFGNAPKAHEIDVRLLRNEMILTEAQQANLFALIKNFDSIARKAEKTIRGGDDEPRYDQTTIQIGQLVVREEMDIYRIAEELNRIKRLEDRSKGVR
ncbi:phage tail tape measure protein [Paenibacillus larvae subsp. pulvifaciens]|uniref:Phage tail tape measure protein n=1 Tax=Paenibacillus larvae subsp. pulvifaciens TaxID=1477 RepID=A0A1V0UQY8_9BACL|nr:phage tail tape measure protein [Paenibacillus larvae]ARF67594.1 phage tail tape measure protein [Paenibacillus larvae subsp. pulvifaciens]